MYHLQIKKKDKFCKQNSLPPIRQKGKKHDKKHKIYSHKKYKRYKNNFANSNDFHAKKKSEGLIPNQPYTSHVHGWYCLSKQP